MSVWVKNEEETKDPKVDETTILDYLDIVNRYGAELYFPIRLEFYIMWYNGEKIYKIIILKAVGSRLSYENEIEDSNLEYKKILDLTSTDIDQLYKSVQTLLENLR